MRAYAVSRWGDAADLSREGAAEGPLKWTFAPGAGETVIRPIMVEGGPLRLRAAGRRLLRWVALVEK